MQLQILLSPATPSHSVLVFCMLGASPFASNKIPVAPETVTEIFMSEKNLTTFHIIHSKAVFLITEHLAGLCALI
jgi:hypothetical protein